MKDEVGFIQGFGALGRSADEDRRERMPNARKEGGFLREGAAIRHHGEGCFSANNYYHVIPAA